MRRTKLKELSVSGLWNGDLSGGERNHLEGYDWLMDSFVSFGLLVLDEYLGGLM